MSAEPAVYLDSSALVKLVVEEPESGGLRHYLAQRPRRISCALARVEVVRAVRPQGPLAIERARRLLLCIGLLRLDETLLDAAAFIEGGVLRSLDAIHLAAAQTLAGDLSEVVTYDVRMADAARLLGLSVTSPG